MTKDAYWDELGIAWVAIEPKLDVAVPLQSHLRRQTLLIGLAVSLAAAASVAGLLLGTATIWLGVTGGASNFVIRGIAILAIASLAGVAANALSAVRRGADTRAVSEMIELSIKRARRWLLAIRLGLYACGLAAVFGLIGTAVRMQLSNPPKMSPVVDLALLALVALALGLGRHRVKGALAKFEYLQRALRVDAGRP